jgi:hypothetical protein
MVWDFNTSGFDWKRGLCLNNSHCYSKHKGDMIYTSKCVLNLTQCIDTVGSSNLFSSICFRLWDFCIISVHPGLAKSDYYQTLRLSIFNSPLTLLFKIKYIRAAYSHLGIMHCFIIFSYPVTGLVYDVPHLWILLSPASLLLLKMPWKRQFPVAS